MKIFEGKLTSEKEIKIGIVCSRFNEFIVSKLLSGSLDALHRHNIKDDNIHIAWVPGSFEIPLIASKMASSKKYQRRYLSWSGNKRFDFALRLCLRGSFKRNCFGFFKIRYSRNVRSFNNGKYRNRLLSEREQNRAIKDLIALWEL